MIHRGERQVDRGRLPAPVDLQMPLEVPCRVIPRPRIAQRIPSIAASGKPGTLGSDVRGLRLLRPGRQRRPLKILQIALDRPRDRVAVDRALVSGSGFRPLRPRHARISSRSCGRNLPLKEIRGGWHHQPLMYDRAG